ncbi:MAG: hypothetical protein JRN20_22215 [Nitrososphaerota archaeon]|nr:hypothetical protein [Nitrososphaerota archaeon]
MKRKEKVAALTVFAIMVILLLTGYAIFPYIVANGVAGVTPFDSPYFRVLAVGMSKGGGTCYLTIVIRNNGNVNVKSLSVDVNGTEIWHTNYVIVSGQVYSSTFDDKYVSFFGCSGINVGQSYSLLLEGRFADGKTENFSTTLYVIPAYPTTTHVH